MSDEEIEKLTDDEKIKKLQEITSYGEIKDVILSIGDEELKVEQLGRLHEWDKPRIIMELKSEISKIKALDYVENEINRYKIILGLSDKAKIEQIKNGKLQKQELIGLIQMSIKDKSLLKEIFLAAERKYWTIGLQPETTIGIEVETEGRSSTSIQKFKKIMENRNEAVGWECKSDETFEENEGVEIASRVLKDDKESVEEIYMVCSMLEKTGQVNTPKCAGQIHVGATGLKSIKAYTNLLEICGNCERILYIMSNEEGEIPREGIREWAAPLSPKINRAIQEGKINSKNETDLNEFITEIKNAQGDRTYGINLKNLGERLNTIEFRMPNGTINPDVWIENARLFGRIVEISQRLVEIEKEQDEKFQRMLMIKEQLKEEVSEQEKMELLLELVLSEDERETYRRRYMSNVKLIEQLPEEKNPFKGIEFAKVDFGKQHTLSEFEKVAAKSTQTRINQTMTDIMHGELIKKEEKQQ